MGYPVILCGDHAEFEAEWAASGRPECERPDWPLPSFDAQDWAAAFLKINPDCGLDEGLMIAWFANALMRGYDEASARAVALDVRCERGCVLKKINGDIRKKQSS